MKDLAGKVAVITGGASGIGLGMAKRFAKEGMRLVLADIEEAALAPVAEGFAAAGRDVLAVQTDVGDAASMDALAERALDRFGAVHVVCNNAGVGTRGQMWELSVKDWEFVLRVNLWGVIHGVRVFAKHLVDQNEGHFVNTASMAGLVSVAGSAPYNVSKHGVVTLSQTLHGELQSIDSQVGVSVLCPGLVRTNLGNSARNRSDDLRNADRDELPAQPANIPNATAEDRAHALSPAEVAEPVLAAVRERQFYILTHEDPQGAIERRMRAILEDGTPDVVHASVFAGDARGG